MAGADFELGGADRGRGHRRRLGRQSGRGKWNVVLALASAQFIMVLDSTVMNVSIEEVITDLDTTVTKMQLAIAAYTLCMAALMLVGGKIGDIIGRLKASSGSARPVRASAPGSRRSRPRSAS